jgi:hypothetical protein
MKYTFTICVRRVWIVIRYFLFEKQAFNGLLKVIGIQNLLYEKSCNINPQIICKIENSQYQHKSDLKYLVLFNITFT